MQWTITECSPPALSVCTPARRYKSARSTLVLGSRGHSVYLGRRSLHVHALGLLTYTNCRTHREREWPFLHVGTLPDPVPVGRQSHCSLQGPVGIYLHPAGSKQTTLVSICAYSGAYIPAGVIILTAYIGTSSCINVSRAVEYEKQNRVHGAQKDRDKTYTALSYVGR